MSSTTLTATDWRLPSQRKVGMITLILTESALFTIFVVAYIFYAGHNPNGPFANQVLKDFPIGGSIALWGSSLTIWRAEKAMHARNWLWFFIWWGITMSGGIYFMYFTANEWYHLITVEHLTLQTNAFGSTFYSLVGLHASHVIIGLVLLSIVLIAGLRGKIHEDHFEHIEMVSWYWHFVDAIWVVVVLTVYIYSVHFVHQ